MALLVDRRWGRAMHESRPVGIMLLDSLWTPIAGALAAFTRVAGLLFRTSVALDHDGNLCAALALSDRAHGRSTPAFFR